MRSFCVSAAVLLATAFIASESAANPQIGPGYTGKQGGSTCNDCHSGGTAPSITVNGPATLAAGAKGDYSAVVSGGGNVKTFAVAATNGVKLTAGTNMSPTFDELYSTSNYNGGSVTFNFSVTAPATSGDITIYYVALASNGSAGKAGDRAANSTKAVSITGGSTPQPDSGTSTGSDGGSSTGGNDGGTGTGGGDDDDDTAGGGGTNSGADGSASGGNGGSPSAGGLPENDDGGGCSLASRASAVSPMGAAAAIAMALGLSMRRRRR